MATIKDVAQASGVSTATVSYVLNNRPGNFSPATRQRVLRAMRDLKYRPAARLGSYTSRGTNTVGIIYPHFDERNVTHSPYYGVVLDGVLGYTSTHQWHLTIFSEKGWEDFRRSLRVYCDGRVDGLILVGLDMQNDMAPALQERGIPFVVINSGSELPDICSVDIDNVDTAEQLTKHLLAHGHRRIAALPGAASHDGTQQRLRGFQNALREAGVSCPPAWMPEGIYSEESGYARTLSLMSAPASERPTALFCGNDYIALGAYRALEERNLSVPGEVSVVGFDDLIFTGSMLPPLTTMHQPLEQLGSTAAKILLDRIAGHSDDITTKVILPAEIIERASVAAPPGLA